MKKRVIRLAPLIAVLVVFACVLCGMLSRYEWEGETFGTERKRYKELVPSNLIVFAVTFYCGLKYPLIEYLTQYYGSGRLMYAAESTLRMTVLMGMDYRLQNVIGSQLSARLAIFFGDFIAIAIEAAMTQYQPHSN